jgi:hypothetical protein
MTPCILLDHNEIKLEFNKRNSRTGGVDHVAKYLLCKHETLSSNPLLPTKKSYRNNGMYST